MWSCVANPCGITEGPDHESLRLNRNGRHSRILPDSLTLNMDAVQRSLRVRAKHCMNGTCCLTLVSIWLLMRNMSATGFVDRAVVGWHGSGLIMMKSRRYHIYV